MPTPCVWRVLSSLLQGNNSWKFLESMLLLCTCSFDFFFSFFFRIYECKFSTHVPVSIKSSGSSKNTNSNTNKLRLVLDSLKKGGSKLADRTKKQLPSYERVETTFRNINWLLRYWMCEPPSPLSSQQQQQQWDYSTCYPDPISAEFGFVLSSSSSRGKKPGVVTWMDEELEDSDK